MRTSDFDYELPRELIAQYPAERRDESRLLVLPPGGAAPEHRRFRDLPDYLVAGDLVVVNESEVIPARLLGRRRGSGGRVEVFLLREVAESAWEVLARPAARLRAGAVVEFGGGELRATVTGVGEAGRRIVEFETAGDLESALERNGLVPLPPYIDRAPEDADRDRYQTVYARVPGAVAAPTAGLHFTEEVFAALEERGVAVARIVLHVGLGTFRPVAAEDPDEHEMEEERYEVSEAAADAVNATRAAGGRIVAVGTTVVRVLESIAGPDGSIAPCEGATSLFIHPPYRFRCVDVLLTNFHLPRSTLLMLVSAFGRRERVIAAYAEAVRLRYRFYSYGDAMLLLGSGRVDSPRLDNGGEGR